MFNSIFTINICILTCLVSFYGIFQHQLETHKNHPVYSSLQSFIVVVSLSSFEWFKCRELLSYLIIMSDYNDFLHLNTFILVLLIVIFLTSFSFINSSSKIEIFVSENLSSSIDQPDILRFYIYNDSSFQWIENCTRKIGVIHKLQNHPGINHKFD